MRFHLAALVLLVPALAGCTDDVPSPQEGDAGPVLPPEERVMATLNAIPAPEFNPENAVDVWENFVYTYPKRDWLTPQNTLAADYLEVELGRAGYETESVMFPATATTAGLPAEVRVVRGVLEGKDPTHRFALVAHYDTVATTTQGAYDDGAGTIAELEICKLLAQRKAQLNHTIECLFFDAEEAGLLASRAYTSWYNATPDRGFVYDLVFGYDMTGINWPGHAWNLYAMIGTQHDALSNLTEPFDAFLRLALHDFLGNATLPGAAEGIEILQVHDRNSDEQSFKRYGIPVVRFAGGRNAADYPQYHQPLDTVEYVYAFVGGRANFVQGYNAVIQSSYYTILGFDAFDPWALPVE